MKVRRRHPLDAAMGGRPRAACPVGAECADTDLSVTPALREVMATVRWLCSLLVLVPLHDSSGGVHASDDGWTRLPLMSWR